MGRFLEIVVTNVLHELRFIRGSIWTNRPAPAAPPLGLFLFGTVLPTRLTVWGFLLVGWIVLLREQLSLSDATHARPAPTSD